MIENAIKARAESSAQLTALIGKRLHFTIGHSSKDNYVLVTVVSDETPSEIHFEDNQSEARIQFDCYSKLPASVKSIRDEIRKTFRNKGFASALLEVDKAIEENRIPSFDTDSKLFRESLDYIFYYSEV